MAIQYKINVLAALKEHGYNTGRLRHEKLLSESVIQKLRTNRGVSLDTIGTICRLLEYQPGDLLEYIADNPENDNSSSASSR